MQYLTPQQYRKWKGMSRQAFHQKVKRRTINLVPRTIRKEELFVPVEDTELEGVNIESLTG